MLYGELLSGGKMRPPMYDFIMKVIYGMLVLVVYYYVDYHIHLFYVPSPLQACSALRESLAIERYLTDKSSVWKKMNKKK